MTVSPVAPAYDFAPYADLEKSVLIERIQRVRNAMGPRLLILGHHYQQDDVIALADLRGDSYQLADLASRHTECEAIAFCGVHFMAETADILANRPEQVAKRNGKRVAVVLPDMEAGCSLADMADIPSGRGLLEAIGRSDRHRRRDADYVRQFCCEFESVLRPAWRHCLHVLQRSGGVGLGLRTPKPGVVLP